MIRDKSKFYPPTIEMFQAITQHYARAFALPEPPKRPFVHASYEAWVFAALSISAGHRIACEDRCEHCDSEFDHDYLWNGEDEIQVDTCCKGCGRPAPGYEPEYDDPKGSWWLREMLQAIEEREGAD